MDKKTIDTICWWIPFRSLRDSIRVFLNSISTIENDLTFVKNNTPPKRIFQMDTFTLQFQIKKT